MSKNYFYQQSEGDPEPLLPRAQDALREAQETYYKDDSYEMRMQRVSSAVQKKFGTDQTQPACGCGPTSVYCSVEYTGDGYVVFKKQDQCYAVDYEDENGVVTLGDNPKKVAGAYVEVEDDEEDIEEADVREAWSDAARKAASAARSRRGRGGDLAAQKRSAEKAYGPRASKSGGKLALAEQKAAAAKFGLTIKASQEQYKSMGGAFTDFHDNPHGIRGMEFTHSETQRGGHTTAPNLRYKVISHQGQIISTGRSAAQALKRAIRNPKQRLSTFYPHKPMKGWEPPHQA